jgi:two-component system, sensor histidine kinase
LSFSIGEIRTIVEKRLENFIKTLNVLYIDGHSEQYEETLALLKKFFLHIDSIKIDDDVLHTYETYYQKNQQYYDIVIMNGNMKTIDKLTQLILSHNQEPHIIIIAEQHNQDMLLKFIEMGVLGLVPKPINPIQFQSLIYHIASNIKKQKLINEQYKDIESINRNLKSAKREAEEASRQKSNFLANMSHEIRTPLNAIMGFISLLHEKETNQKKREYLDVVKSASDSLLKVISDILDITKIENGKLQIEQIPFNPYETLIHTTELFQAKASEKGVVFKVNFSKHIPEILISDPFRIQQILANLLSNAIKFTPEGSTVKCIIWYANGSLHIRVKDYGIGIVEEKHDYIFEAFSQADNTMATEYGGTGLGLALCAEMTKLLGGTISFKSHQNGSIFTLVVNMEIGEKIQKETIDNSITSHNTFLEGHILIVEDIAANRMFLGILLENMNLTYDMAASGLEAIDKFKTNKYDMILMDENMPGLNGTATTKEILKLEKKHELEHTPIISLTANALKGDRERFLNAGMDDYISKPIDNKTLYYTLKKYLI